MKVKCPNCGYKGEGNFCRKCGSPLPKPSSTEEESYLPEGHWTAKCPVCKSAPLKLVSHKIFFGLGTSQNLECTHCGAVFRPDNGRYKLVSVNDKTNPVWRDYQNQSLTEQEWKNIASGGLSFAKQRELDMGRWVVLLKEGQVNMQVLGDSSPILLGPGEKLQIVLSNIALWEPRSVRRSTGGYGGPSIRIMKGVYLRVGTFNARGESHEELRAIDQGIFTLTNKRIVFSGSTRTVDISLNKIISIEPYIDGIAVRTSNRQKTQYFVGISPGKVTIELTIENRKYKESLTGLMLKYLIEGLAKKQNFLFP
jgi:hypothetical protein